MKALKCSCSFLECESFSWVSYVILIIMIEVIRTLNREKIWIKSLISKKAASSSQSCSSVCSHRLFKQSYLTTSLYHSPEGPECQYVCSCIPILESQDWHSHLWFIHGIPLRAPSLFAPFMVISPSALHSSCLSARYESEPAGYPSHPEWRPPVHRWDAEWWGVLGVQHPGAGGSNTQEVWRWWNQGRQNEEKDRRGSTINQSRNSLNVFWFLSSSADRWRTSGWRSSPVLACVSSWTARRPRCAPGCSWWRRATTPPTPTTTPRTPQTCCTPLPTSCAKRESRLEETHLELLTHLHCVLICAPVSVRCEALMCFIFSTIKQTARQRFSQYWRGSVSAGFRAVWTSWTRLQLWSQPRFTTWTTRAGPTPSYVTPAVSWRSCTTTRPCWRATTLRSPSSSPSETARATSSRTLTGR